MVLAERTLAIFAASFTLVATIVQVKEHLLVVMVILESTAHCLDRGCWGARIEVKVDRALLNGGRIQNILYSIDVLFGHGAVRTGSCFALWR